jgi:hypothetical protein
MNYKREEYEIDSEIDCLMFCIKSGRLKIYCEDDKGDITLASVRLRHMPRLIEELQGIYDTYVKDVRLMKYLKEE